VPIFSPKSPATIASVAYVVGERLSTLPLSLMANNSGHMAVPTKNFGSNVMYSFFVGSNSRYILNTMDDPLPIDSV